MQKEYSVRNDNGELIGYGQLTTPEKPVNYNGNDIVTGELKTYSPNKELQDELLFTLDRGIILKSANGSEIAINHPEKNTLPLMFGNNDKFYEQTAQRLTGIMVNHQGSAESLAQELSENFSTALRLKLAMPMGMKSMGIAASSTAIGV